MNYRNRLIIGLSTIFTRSKMHKYAVVLVDEADTVFEEGLIKPLPNSPELCGMIYSVDAPLLILVSATWPASAKSVVDRLYDSHVETVSVATQVDISEPSRIREGELLSTYTYADDCSAQIAQVKRYLHASEEPCIIYPEEVTKELQKVIDEVAHYKGVAYFYVKTPTELITL